MKRLYPTSVALGVATIMVSVAALAVDISLPYRIGFVDYGSYQWVGRLAAIPVALAVLAFLCGIGARKSWISPGLAILALTPLLLIGGVHSGPNPEAWCYNNLRQIEAAKDQLAQDHGLTNGSPVKAADIPPFMPAGREPRCAKRGTYIINSIGSDARCTVHGTISEMEAAWQKAMRAHPASATNR